MNTNTNGDTWSKPPENPVLAAHEVHLWRCRVDLPDDDLARCHRLLNPAEKQQAARFLVAADRNRFTVARASLRLILASYLGCPPGDISFVIGAHGKPSLQAADGLPPLEFNISHSGTLALVCVADAGRPVGVDVEWTGRDLATMDLARRVLSPREFRTLEQAPPARRKHLFLSFWTIKEAVVKALGRGMSLPLSSITVTFPPGRPPRLEGDVESTGISDLTVMPLDLDQEHMGAVATAGARWSLRCWSAAGIQQAIPGRMPRTGRTQSQRHNLRG